MSKVIQCINQKFKTRKGDEPLQLDILISDCVSQAPNSDFVIGSLRVVLIFLSNWWRWRLLSILSGAILFLLLAQKLETLLLHMSVRQVNKNW